MLRGGVSEGERSKGPICVEAELAWVRGFKMAPKMCPVHYGVSKERDRGPEPLTPNLGTLGGNYFPPLLLRFEMSEH